MSKKDGFFLHGPGVSKQTAIAFTGKVSWTVTLRAGLLPLRIGNTSCKSQTYLFEALKRCPAEPLQVPVSEQREQKMRRLSARLAAASALAVVTAVCTSGAAFAGGGHGNGNGNGNGGGQDSSGYSQQPQRSSPAGMTARGSPQQQQPSAQQPAQQQPTQQSQQQGVKPSSTTSHWTHTKVGSSPDVSKRYGNGRRPPRSRRARAPRTAPTHRPRQQPAAQDQRLPPQEQQERAASTCMRTRALLVRRPRTPASLPSRSPSSSSRCRSSVNRERTRATSGSTRRRRPTSWPTSSRRTT